MHYFAKLAFLMGMRQELRGVSVMSCAGLVINLNLEAKLFPPYGRVIEATRRGKTIWMPWDWFFSKRPNFANAEEGQKQLWKALRKSFRVELKWWQEARAQAKLLSRQYFNQQERFTGYVCEVSPYGLAYLYREVRDDFVRFTLTDAPLGHFYQTLLLESRFRPIWVELYGSERFCGYFYPEPCSLVCPETRLVHYLEHRYLKQPTLSARKKESAHG